MKQWLKELSLQGAHFWLEGEELCYDIPQALLTSDHLNRLRSNKAEIIKLLKVGTLLSPPQALSPGQQALWFIQQQFPETIGYNTAFALRVLSPVDGTLFERTLQILTERHPVLRSTISLIEDLPMQQIYGYVKVNFTQIDMASQSVQDMDQCVLDCYRQPFDLAHGPLLRAYLISLTETNHVFLLVIHHIINDFWSGSIIMREFWRIYPTLVRGGSIRLPDLKFQYRHYVHWQQELLASSIGKRQWRYWQQQLADYNTKLELPLDYPRNTTQSPRAGYHSFKLDKNLTFAIVQIAQQQGTTPYVVLLSAFQILLHRYTRQTDIVVGSPVSGRTQLDFYDVAGYFVNLLMMRGDLSANPPFIEYLKQMQATVSAALEHQDFPFSELVRRLQPKRDLSHSPFYQVDFTLQTPPKSEDMALLFNADETECVTLGDCLLSPYHLTQQGAQCDLGLELIQVKDRLSAVFKYDAGLFRKNTIQRLSEHFKALLVSTTTTPEARLSELQMLSTAEEQQLLRDWNQTESLESEPVKRIDQLFANVVRQQPDSIALRFRQQQLSYRELDRRSHALACYLQDNGIGAGKLVGIYMPRGLEMIVAVLAVIKSGGIYLPLNRAYPSAYLAEVVSSAQPGIILSLQTLNASLQTFYPGEIYVVDGKRPPISDYDDRDLALVQPEDNPLLYALYTSGTTGKPKGVLGTHRGAINRVQWMWQTYPFLPDEVCCLKTDLNFVRSVAELFGPLLAGVPTVIMPEGIEKNVSVFLSLLAQHKICRIILTPSLLHTLLHNYPQLTTLLADIRYWMSTGEALSSSTVELFYQCLPDRVLINLYGSTEVASDVACHDFSQSPYVWQSAADNQMPIGRPITNNQIYILDAFQKPVPVGVLGELHVAGVHLADSYLNDEALTQNSFVHNTFDRGEQFPCLYKTGDFGYYQNDGTIIFSGRIDRQVNSRGFRIELTAIEAVLATHASVQQAVVSTRETAQGGVKLIAYVVVDSENTFDSSGLHKALRTCLLERLPAYMVPNNFLIVSKIPLTDNGKVDFATLNKLKENSTDHAYIAPRNLNELKLAQIWEDLLETVSIGITDDFFESGGYSLLAVRLASRIEKEWGRKLPVTTFFQHTTIEALARLLTEDAAINWSCLVPIQPKGNRPALFFVHPTGGTVFQYVELARHIGNDIPFYGIQALGTEIDQQPLRSVEDMADYYIAQLEAAQPQEHYFLGGWSFGGYVAYEMACQLAARGKNIAWLVILDTPSHPTPKKAIATRETIDNLTADQLRQIMGYIALEEQMTAPGFSTEEVRQFLRVFYNSCQAGSVYNPRPYSGKLTLFRAQDHDQKVLDHYANNPSLGWSDLVDSVDIHDTLGSHTNLLLHPYVKSLAAEIRRLIDKL